MRWLLDNGANPNALSCAKPGAGGPESVSETPLHRIAAFGLGYTVARLLVTHGATVDAERGDGKTAYILAVRAGNMEVAHYLEEVGADISRLSELDKFVGACARGDVESANAIVADNPLIVSTLNEDDQQAVAVAAEEGNEDSVRLMIALGWSLSVEGPWAGTPLHHAAWCAQIEMTRLLIEAGAPLDARDRAYAYTALEWAAHGAENAQPGHENEYVVVEEMLLKAGASRESGPC